MLVTDPEKRATLSEILVHPWMTKGFNTPPENYLPHREPIQLPLDETVIDKMTGFDFGSTDFIIRELTKVLQSEEYLQALALHNRDATASPLGGEKKRGVFDFYKRRNSTTSRDTLPNLSVEAIQAGSDPINAFSPLLSIYYLVREKQERERLEANPGALSMPISPGEKPLKLPDLPAPEPAFTNISAYEMAGEKPTGGRSRPRARTHGEDEVAENMKKVNLNVPPSPAIVTTPPPQASSGKKESTAAGLLRRFSTRRNKDSTRERTENLPAPSLQIQAPTDAAPSIRKSFSVRRSRNRDSTLSPMIHSAGSQPHRSELLTPPMSDAPGSRGSSALNRSTSVNSGEHRPRTARRGISEGLPTGPNGDPPYTSGSDRSSEGPQRVKINEPPQAEQQPSANSRSPAVRTKSLGHTRRESMQARRTKREELRQSNVPEETDMEVNAAEDVGSRTESTEQIKPVYLKGLFSVSTTSSKPLPYIRNDIIRVLRQLGVQYSEIRGGFSCKHMPSINLNANAEKSTPGPSKESNHRRRISFLGGSTARDTGSEREDYRDQEKSPNQFARGSSRRQADASYTNSEDSEEDVRRGGASGNATRAAGETSTHVENDLGSNLVLKFEIFLVKVPLFSLHGIQFKKVAGGTWQYKEMAQKILDALRL